MPRCARIEIPGVAFHLTQRGVNHCAIFADDHDRRHFVGLLDDARRRHRVALHAWVLMGNHVHMLASAHAEGALGRMMRSLGQRYVQAFNARHRRSGGLWQGRFKACAVEGDGHLLRVIRYIELNPVRAAIASDPAGWPWSSARDHLGLATGSRLDLHPSYLALGRDRGARADAWRAVLHERLDPRESERIRLHLRRQRALGEPRFVAMLEAATGRALAPRPLGRRPCAPA